MPRWVTTPYAAVAMLEPWNAPAGRYFVAYSPRRGFRALAGVATIDEFATVSSPVFFCPRSMLGKIYNVGISLGHRRDPEMGLDLGWPPLCVGLDLPAPALPPSFEEDLLDRIQNPGEQKAADGDGGGPLAPRMERVRIDPWYLDCYRIAEATLLVTDAPLLPLQLERLCEESPATITIGIATGNRLAWSRTGEPLTIEVVSESQLLRFTETVESLFA